MIKKHLLAMAACAFALPMTQAQTPVPEEVAGDDGVVRIIEIEQVQVNATRAGKKTPVAYSDIDKEQIEKLNYGQDIPYLLTLTPSVVATSDAGTGIGYTGVRIRGVDASRINVTSNGVPLNDAESHSLFWVNTPDFASSVEDIQVQRGVGTSTNGAGAFGGSINMRTESLVVEPYAEAGLSYGSFNTHREVVKVNTGLINGKWAFGARLSNMKSDGYIERASSDMKSYFFQGGYYNGGTMVKFITFGGNEKTYHAWDGVTAEQIAEHGRRYNPCGIITGFRRDADGNVILDADGNRIEENQGFYKNQNDVYRQTHYNLIFNQSLSASWILNATLHWTDGEGYYEEYKNGRTLEEYGLTPFLAADPLKMDYVDEVGMVGKSNLIRQKRMDNDFYGGIVSANYAHGRWDISMGGAWNRYAGSHFGKVIWVKNYIGELDPDHEYYRNRTDKRDMNLFARANFDATGRLSIYGDVQYRRITHKINGTGDNWDWRDGENHMQLLRVDRTYDFFNPKAGLFFRADDRNSIYASFAAAHKEPTRNNYTDAKFDAHPSAERLFDYELGYSYRSRIFSAGVNLYYMDYKDQLVLTGEMNEIGELLSDNVAKSYRMGVELTAGVQIAPWLRWDVNATLSRNIIRDYTEYLGSYNDDGTQHTNYIGDTPISYSPSIIAGSLISANWGDLSVGLQSQYVGSQYVSNSKQDELMLDAYFVNNIRVDYTFKLRGLKRLNVGVAVNNFLNEQYASNGWGSSWMEENSAGQLERVNLLGLYPQATANFLVNVSVRF